MTLDEAVEVIAADDYPIDTVVWRAMELAQRHALDFRAVLLGVARERTRRGLQGAREPFLWVVVEPGVTIGDNLPGGAVAYQIHTDERGVRRARIAPAYELEDQPVFAERETVDPRRTLGHRPGK